MASEPKKRKLNFTFDVIIDEVEQNHGVLFSLLTSTKTNQEKGRIWRAITDNVNAVSLNERSVVEVRRKWSDITPRAKTKYLARKREAGKTGGGNSNATPLTDEDERCFPSWEMLPLMGFLGQLTQIDPQRK